MTKKRHAKLLRAFATKIHVYAQANYLDYKAPHGKEMYKCVRLAENGLIPVNPATGVYTRQDWWKFIKPSLEIFGMGDIKEVN
jgi:hypothetical protein